LEAILAYIAGIIDGEGSIWVAVYKRKFTPLHAIGVTVGMTDPQAVDLLQQVYPGSYNVRTIKSGKTMYRWCITAKKARRFLEDIYEYLRVKKEQARLAIELESRKSFTRYPYSLSEDELAIRENIRREIQILNKSRYLKPKTV